MKMKKGFMMLLLVLLMTVLLLGCQSAADSSNGVEDNNADQSDNSGKTNTLKWYVVSATGPQADSERVQKAMSDYINKTYGWNI